MKITLKQITAFIAIVESGSFTDACGRLHLTQPALSASIKNLESAIGGILLQRGGGRISLTPEGEVFYPMARQLLVEFDASIEDMKGRFALKKGTLKLAAMSTFSANLLPKIIAEFHGLHPAIKVIVHDVIAESVVDLVRRGIVELGISFYPGQNSELEFCPLFEDHFVVVLPAHHPLADAEEISWLDLNAEDYICLQKPSSIREMIDTQLSAGGVSLVPSFEAHQLITVGAMVAEGLGVSIVPGICARQLELLGATCRPLESPSVSRQVGMLYRKNSILSAPAEAMRICLQPPWSHSIQLS